MEMAEFRFYLRWVGFGVWDMGSDEENAGLGVEKLLRKLKNEDLTKGLNIKRFLNIKKE